MLKIGIKDSDQWTTRRWHGVPDKRQWKLVDEGLLLNPALRQKSASGRVERTKGEPKTLMRIVDRFMHHIQNWSQAFDVPPQMLAAVIATESGGRPDAERYEKHLNDTSIGLMQALTNTARAVSRLSDSDMVPTIDLDPQPKGGDIVLWRELLSDPETSIGLGALHLSYNNKQWNLQWDPILNYAAFNAGSLRKPKAPDNQWGMRAAAKGVVLDHFARWYGDACHVVGYSV